MGFYLVQKQLTITDNGAVECVDRGAKVALLAQVVQHLK